MAGLFEYIKMISQTKEIPEFDDEFEKEYNVFMVNRFFSLFYDTSIIIAQSINKNSPIPKKAHFLYMHKMVRKGKRFGKWPKPQKEKDIELLQDILQCNRQRAKEARQFITDEQIKELQESENNKGGVF